MEERLPSPQLSRYAGYTAQTNAQQQGRRRLRNRLVTVHETADERIRTRLGNVLQNVDLTTGTKWHNGTVRRRWVGKIRDHLAGWADAADERNGANNFSDRRVHAVLTIIDSDNN